METPNIPLNKRPVSRTKSIISSVVGLATFFLVVGLFRYFGDRPSETVTAVDTKQELIKQTVAEYKNSTTFPQEIDSVTTLTDVLEVPGAIRYIYTIHDADVSGTTNESLKEAFVPEICGTKETKEGLLDQGIKMEYSYTVRESGQNYFFVVTTADCV